MRSFDCYLYKNNHCVLPFLGHKNYESIYGDICAIKDLQIALNGVSDVILLAGLVGDPITNKYPEVSKLINEYGIKQMIKLKVKALTV